MNDQTIVHLQRLKELAESAGKGLFERAGLALEILADTDWLVENHGGDRRAAELDIAEEYFPDVTATEWFNRLLILRRHYSDIAVWEQHRFSLQRIWIRYEDEQKQHQPMPAPRKQFMRKHRSNYSRPSAGCNKKKSASRSCRAASLNSRNSPPGWLQETTRKMNCLPSRGHCRGKKPTLAMHEANEKTRFSLRKWQRRVTWLIWW